MVLRVHNGGLPMPRLGSRGRNFTGYLSKQRVRPGVFCGKRVDEKEEGGHVSPSRYFWRKGKPIR